MNDCVSDNEAPEEVEPLIEEKSSNLPEEEIKVGEKRKHDEQEEHVINTFKRRPDSKEEEKMPRLSRSSSLTEEIVEDIPEAAQLNEAFSKIFSGKPSVKKPEPS